MKTEEEIKGFLDSERIELSHEELEAISGGGLFDIIGDAIRNLIDPLIDEIL